MINIVTCWCFFLFLRLLLSQSFVRDEARRVELSWAKKSVPGFFYFVFVVFGKADFFGKSRERKGKERKKERKRTTFDLNKGIVVVVSQEEWVPPFEAIIFHHYALARSLDRRRTRPTDGRNRICRCRSDGDYLFNSGTVAAAAAAAAAALFRAFTKPRESKSRVPPPYRVTHTKPKSIFKKGKRKFRPPFRQRSQRRKR